MNTYSKLIASIGLTCLYVYLFYDETWGFNTLVFSPVAIGILLWQNQEMIKSINGRLAIVTHVSIAIAAAWHGGIAVGVCYHGSLLVLTGMAFAPQSSVLVALINGFLSRMWKGLEGALRYATTLPALGIMSRFVLWRQTVLYAAPVSITFLFYWLYTLANPDFVITIQWPIWQWDWELFLYFLASVFVSTSILFPSGWDKPTQYDISMGNVLIRNRGKGGSIKLENKQGIIMFVLLNALIFCFLIFNLSQIILPGSNPQSASHSDQVHSSFNSVLISVIIAIFLIVYYFRGNQNFYSGNKRLKYAASVWIALNFGLVCLTVFKNLHYVQEFGLTYKRIWVFIAMTATAIGLYLTYIKIFKLKSSWYLVRVNSWVVYLMLTTYMLVDWNRLIANYNIHYARQTDWAYLNSLDLTAFPEIVKNSSHLSENQRYDIERACENSQYIWSSEKGRSWKSNNIDDIYLTRNL